MSGTVESLVPRVRFHQWCEPALPSGQYRLHVRQEVAKIEAAGEKAFTSHLDFAVDGPRFALSPTDVYSVYPPKGQVGGFGGTLPHVVLSRRTLPWERTLRPGPRREGDTTPWLALLTLAAADFPHRAFPEVRTQTLRDLLTPEKGLAKPALHLQAFEHEDDLCATIDLPMDLFREIAPTEKELALLSHVREVQTGAKETACTLGEGWFSVVIANRPPLSASEETECLACLVSLEGVAGCLPGTNEPTHAKVRLAVLSSWRFGCSRSSSAHPSAADFEVAVNRMREGGVLALAVPWEGSKPEREAEAEWQVYRAFRMGYTALNHSTRLGERTVSWYRGPLIPEAKPKSEVLAFRPVPDAALRYSPEDGMLDVSYAAAFQLGRLLGLQSRHFAQELQRFRKRVRFHMNEALEGRRAADALGGRTSALASVVIGTLGDRAVKTELPIAAAFGATIPGPVPRWSISRWLARLALLYRVPFAYLVPDARMLPPDSIRFFRLDPNWIKCLLEGACSVGRSSSRDELVDEQLRSRFFDLALEQALDVRTGGAGDTDAGGSSADRSRMMSPRWPLTGFLMRSRVVEGWQGLEMRAWEDSDQKTPLEPLRIDRLAPDILLCIFNGDVRRMEISQPPEGLHFGLSVDPPDGTGSFYKSALRDTGDKDPGGQLSGGKLAVPMRANEKRVLNVADLADSIRKRLAGTSAETPPLTSAQFATQMIASAVRVIFDRKHPPRVP